MRSTRPGTHGREVLSAKRPGAVRFERYREAHPEFAAEFERRVSGALPEGLATVESVLCR